MKGKVLAVLLATTCLTPGRADADPVSAFIAGISAATSGSLAALTAGVFTYTGFSAVAFSAGVFAGVIGGTFIGRTLLGIGLSALAAGVLAPQFNIPKPAARMGNFAQPISYAEYVFGRTRKGGPLGFTGAQNSRRYYVPILAAHEIEGVVEHWLDEWTVGLNGAAASGDANLLSSDDDMQYTAPGINRFGRIDVLTGGSGQVANAGLVSEFSEITTSHDFAGLSGAVVWAAKASPEKFSDVYPRSKQWDYLPVIDGWNQIYDPRYESTGYSNNAALCLAKWITDILGETVDWADVAIEAAICDEQVTNGDGDTQPRWTINGTLSDDQPFETQRAQMAGACDAYLFERPDGKVGFRVGRWIAPTVTLTAADFSRCTLRAGQWGADAPTEVAIVYTEPANAWREASAGVWIEDSTARRVRDEPQMFMIHSHNQASRIAKRIAKARRPEWKMEGAIGLIGMELIGQRFFRFDHADMGVTIDMEISRLTRVGPAAFEVEAVSTQESDFAFNAATEEPERPLFKSVDSSFVSPAVTGVSATAGDGPSILVEWSAQPDYLTQQIQWRADGDVDWQTATLSQGGVSYTILGLTDGTTYEVQVRNASALTLSSPSDWAPDPALSVAAVASSTAPSALQLFLVSVTGSDVVVAFIPPNEPIYAGTRIWRGTDAVFTNASLIRTEYVATSWTDAGPAADDYWYWAAPINTSGVQGPQSGPQSITVT